MSDNPLIGHGNNYYGNTDPLGRVGETPQEAQESTMDGAGLIAAERRRQVEAEGWTPEHDDQHEAEELLAAAACYINVATQYDIGMDAPPWPWEPSWWKPSADPIRNLVKAGALIAAEIDRLQRGRS